MINSEQARSLRDLFEECHDRSWDAGWWTFKEGDLLGMLTEIENNTELGAFVVATKLTLIHSEISEAMEGYRTDAMDDKLPHRPSIEVELADAIIRIGDLASALDLDVAGAIAEKFEVNSTRSDHKPDERAKKGGKKF